MYEIEVGKPFVQGLTHYEEGATFSCDNSGLILRYSLSDPTKEEIASMKHGDYSFAVCELPNIMFFLAKIGNMRWTDSPYSPNLGGSFTLQEPSEGLGYNMLVVLVDAGTGIVMVIHTIGLPTTFSVKLKSSIEKYRLQPSNRTTHQDAIDAAYAKYTTDDFVSMAQYHS